MMAFFEGTGTTDPQPHVFLDFFFWATTFLSPRRAKKIPGIFSWAWLGACIALGFISGFQGHGCQPGKAEHAGRQADGRFSLHRNASLKILAFSLLFLSLGHMNPILLFFCKGRGERGKGRGWVMTPPPHLEKRQRFPWMTT